MLKNCNIVTISNLKFTGFKIVDPILLDVHIEFCISLLCFSRSCRLCTYFLVDGDGWLSLFQLVGGNRGLRSNHPTIIQKRSSCPRPDNTRCKSAGTRRKITAICSSEFLTRRRCTLAKFVEKLSVIDGTTRRYIGLSPICVRCVSRRSLGGTI